MMRIEPFAFAGLPSRVIFGSGTLAQSGAEIARLGRKRALVLSTPNQRADAEALASRFGLLLIGGHGAHVSVRAKSWSVCRLRRQLRSLAARLRFCLDLRYQSPNC